MKNGFLSTPQLSPRKQLFYHFYPGLAILIVYILAGPWIVDSGYPGLTTLLLAELFILAPIGLGHLLWHSRKSVDEHRFRKLLPFTKKLSIAQYFKWSLLGMLACILVYLPLYPMGLYVREQVFHWLPEWYFNPIYGTTDTRLLAKVFLAGILIDGIIGPTVEELYFRGYLLPRMTYLGKWAPIINGLLFGLYHFWQPHNYLAIIGIGIILSSIVWKKQNVYLGILIHCTLNILGSLTAYLAASSGELIMR